MSVITQEMWDELNRKYNALEDAYKETKKNLDSLLEEFDALENEMREAQSEHISLARDYKDLSDRYEWVRLNEELYRVAIGLTDHTISVVDIKEHTLNQIYNEGDWTGIAMSMENAPESVIETGIIHPDDCDGYREFYKRIYSGEPKGEYTMRVMEENRGWVWFTMYYQTTFDEEGNPVRAICFSDDITVEMAAQEKFRQYRNAVTTDADYVWEANLSRDILLSEDDAFEEVFGEANHTKFSEIFALGFKGIRDEVQREQLTKIFKRENLIKAYNSAQREVTAEYQFDGNDGYGARWHRATAYLMSNSVQEVMCILCVNDITESQKEREALEHKAERDSLTGIYNRFGFESRMTNIIMGRPTGSHGFLIMDIDDFKYYNDNYGHAFGDKVLQLLADVLMQSFRISDVVGRAGGDEFMVFMDGVGSKEAMESRTAFLQKELRDTCLSRDFPKEVTISIGGAFFSLGDDFESLYLKADKALYESKDKGKNCYTIV